MKKQSHLVFALALFVSLHNVAAQSFVLSSMNTVGLNAPFVTAADVNGDGEVDLISVYSTNSAAFSTNNSLIMLTNNGNGVFYSNAVYYAGKFPESVVAADINGDGKLDLISADSDGTLSVLTNNGNGGFGSNLTYAVNGAPFSVIAADINGDGRVDLISANAGNYPNPYTLLVLTNNGNGGFGSNATYAVGATMSFGPSTVIAADVNGDGWLDLISANPGKNALTIFTNNRDGYFTLASLKLVPSSPESVIATDVDGHGNVQLICANFGSKMLSVLTNNGSSVFNIAYNLNVGSEPYSVTAADVNGDDKTDLICAGSTSLQNPAGTLIIFTNNGAGIFVSNATYAVGNGPESVVTADVNGDGRLDLISVNSGTNTLSILTNASTFLPRLTIKSSTNYVLVSWASTWTGWAGWTLQENASLNPANWTDFNGTFGDNGTIKSVTNSSLAGNLFFRLSHP